MSIKHIYVHIPFCKNKCPYCDFFSVPISSYDIKNKYTTAIIKDLKNKEKLISLPLKTLYFGGGSPIMIGIKNLKKIVSKLKPYINKKTELSIELNPEHLEKKQKTILKELHNMGFNRISIGVQTTNRQILKKIKRKYNKEELIKTLDELRKTKRRISLDFMFGLPGQSLKDLKNDLDFIKTIMPEHLSFYSFTPPEGYKLIKKCASDDLSCKMLELISNELTKLNYKHYEVSNFCLGSNLCLHNMAYWERKSYIGLGAGAHSFYKDQKTRRWNVQNIKKYIKEPNSSYEFEVLDKKMEKNENIFLGLRLLNKGVKEHFLDKKKYKEYLDNGLLKISNKSIIVTKKGLKVLNYLSSSLLS
jgi:oxygen-independent coproporphyrinogen III oxidase